MRLPLCLLCGKNTCPTGELEGGWIKFSDFVPTPPLPKELPTGGPPGIELFCNEHLPTAQALTHLSSKEALAELQRQFGVFPESVYKPKKLTWWQWLRSWF